MPVPKMISPLMDHLISGDAISQHNGISCYPAMNQDTKQKYILKVISVPSSPAKLDALLLTGALKDEDAARQYYEDLANETVREIEAVQKLARQEGFVPFAGYQLSPKEDCIGYDIYILTHYHRTLARQFEKKPLSKLNAMNLGLDICSALTACRRNGYIFVNLKPENICVGENGDYRIADLGILPLQSLTYAIMPEHYIGHHTAPEITDVLSPLNDRLDVYAIGSILYQIYNGGTLPPKDSAFCPPPAYADDELSQIILKAIALSPQDRWESPAHMGQMLVSYMQKNGISDDPIVPVKPVSEEAETPAEEVILPVMPSLDESIPETPMQEDILPQMPALEEALPEPETPSQDETLSETEMPASITEDIAQETEEPESAEENIPEEPEESESAPTEDFTEEPAKDAPAAEAVSPSTEDEISSEPEQLSMASLLTPSDTASEDTLSEPELSSYESPYSDLSDEVSQILAQADALAEMTAPEPAVAPSPAVISIPEETMPEEPAAQTTAFEDTPDTLTTPAEPQADAETEEKQDMKTTDYFDDEYFDEETPAKKSHWLRNTIIVAVLLLILLGGFLFYQSYVLRTVSQFEHRINGNTLTVYVTSQVAEADLYVSCSDGKITSTGQPQNGMIEFSNLQPNTAYTITLDVKGLHILKGYTPIQFETADAARIVNPKVTVGDKAGTVKIRFDVEGGDSERWSFTYQAAGEAPKTVDFSGNSFTLSGLRDNTEYKGYLTPEKELMISEPLEIVFSASELIQAKDLRIVSCSGDALTAQWTAPDNVTVESWFARCYNASYDETLSDIKGTTATFKGLDSTQSFTVEVWAKDQTVRQTVTLDGNSITVRNVSADTMQTGKITLNWKSSAEPQNGWVITYTVNDSKTVFTEKASDTTLVISPVLPEAKYTFSIKAADSSVTTFCDDYTCHTPSSVSTFSLAIEDETITDRDLQYTLCKRPSGSSWSFSDLTPQHYTHNFRSGENGAILFYLKKEYKAVPHTLSITLAITDEDGGLVSISTTTAYWDTMWNQNYYGLNMTQTPRDVGCYNAAVYINNALVADFAFAVY